MSEPCEIDTLPENGLGCPVLYDGNYYMIDSFMLERHVISFAVTGADFRNIHIRPCINGTFGEVGG